MTDLTKLLLIVGLAFLGFIAYNAHTNDKPQTSSTYTRTPNVVQTTPYVAPRADRQVNAMGVRERQAWVDGCMSEYPDLEYCGCTFDYINARLTLDEVEIFVEQVEAGNYPDIFWNAIENCL